MAILTFEGRQPKMAINSIGGVSEPQNTQNINAAEETQSRSVTYTANGVTKTVEAGEDELQELQIEDEESNEEKIYNSKAEDCQKQLDQLYDQLKQLKLQLYTANQQIATCEDIASAESQIDSINQSINKVYDNINSLLLTMMSYESELEASTMDFVNSGGTSADASKFTFREGATEEGKNVVATAMKYDDKSASEMQSIMQGAGYKYHEGAWCADFATFALGQAYGGMDKIPGNFASTCPNTAYCPSIVEWANGNGSWTTDPNTLQPGDLVLFDWDGDGTSDHVGIFVSVNSDGTINTVEGNTSGAAGGSCVETKIRSPQTIKGYSRISGLS